MWTSSGTRIGMAWAQPCSVLLYHPVLTVIALALMLCTWDKSNLCSRAVKQVVSTVTLEAICRDLCVLLCTVGTRVGGDNQSASNTSLFCLFCA